MRSKRHRRHSAQLDKLLEICRLNGITSGHLRQIVHDTCTDGIFKDSPVFAQREARAKKTTKAGLSAQLSYLKKVMGMTALLKLVQNTGGILDAIVLHTSSSQLELEEDVGRDNIDEDGHVH